MTDNNPNEEIHKTKEEQAELTPKGKKRALMFRIAQCAFAILLVVSVGFLIREQMIAKENDEVFNGIAGLIPQNPTVNPNPTVTLTPTQAPTATPSATPQITPTPSQEPATTPQVSATPEATPIPTPEPTPMPTPEPTPVPTPQPTPSVYDKYGAVLELNDDMIGWITIDGTKINYPVMQTPEAEHYYLYRDFYGKDSVYGTPYAMANCKVGESDNIILYGHHMKNGSMFSNLIYYQTPSSRQKYWESHRYVQFDTFDGGYGKYEIFAAFNAKVPSKDSFGYTSFTKAESKEEYDKFVQTCLNRSVIKTGIVPQYGDELLTLVTCEFRYKNKYGRFVVVARKISE